MHPNVVKQVLEREREWLSECVYVCDGENKLEANKFRGKMLMSRAQA